MGMKRWNAERYHRTHMRRTGPLGTRGRALLAAGVLGLVALATGAVGVMETTWDSERRIVICHATGSAEQPFVRLVVPENGFEHGHHRHHTGDFFKSDPNALCDDDPVTILEATEPESNETTPETTEPEQPGNETAPPAPEENGTAPDSTPDENAPEPAPPAPADAAVRQAVLQDDEEVTIRLEVVNVGGSPALNVRLTDALPDVRRAWLLSGPDAAACTLADRDLSCHFGELAPEASKSVVLRAYTDRMPCGNHRTNTAYVTADEDANAANDASSGGILARSC